MATTTGLVHWMFIVPSGLFTCVYIGPSPANVEALSISRDAADPPHTGAFKISMMDALAQALASRHEVTVHHPDYDHVIYSVEVH